MVTPGRTDHPEPATNRAHAPNRLRRWTVQAQDGRCRRKWSVRRRWSMDTWRWSATVWTAAVRLPGPDTSAARTARRRSPVNHERYDASAAGPSPPPTPASPTGAVSTRTRTGPRLRPSRRSRRPSRSEARRDHGGDGTVEVNGIADPVRPSNPACQALASAG